MNWRALTGKNPVLIINFIADAAGGDELVRNALEAYRTGHPFVLPLKWRLVNATAGVHSVKEKTLHLEYIDDWGGRDSENATQPEPPSPSSLKAEERIVATEKHVG